MTENIQRQEGLKKYQCVKCGTRRDGLEAIIQHIITHLPASKRNQTYQELADKYLPVKE